MALLTRLSDAVAWLCRMIIVGSVIAMIIFLFGQIIMRYFFRSGFPWAEELAVTLCAWVVLLGAGLGVREGYHVRFTILTDTLPKSFATSVEIFVNIVCMGFGIAIAYSGYTLSSESIGMDSATLGAPVWIFYTVTVLSGIVIAFFSLENIVLRKPPKFTEEIDV